MSDETESKPKHPVTPDEFLRMVPSSRANPPRPIAQASAYHISVQRKNPANNRWLEIAGWDVFTTEEDMSGPLNCGLKSNYRIMIHNGEQSPE
jgi:hypothetical protein